MSYILDALKKAERERGMAEVPKLESVHDVPLKNKTGIWIVAGCSALCLVASAWLFFSASSGRNESKATESAAVKQGRITEDADIPPEKREPMVQNSGKPPAYGEIDMNQSVPVIKNAPVTVTPQAKPRSAIAKPPVSVPKAKAEPPVTALTDETPGNEPPVYESAELSAPDVVMSAVVNREPSPVSVKLPSLREIAASIKVSVHIFSENPAESLVFINGKQRREGARLEHDCVLESITPDGMILRRGDETFIFRVDNP